MSRALAWVLATALTFNPSVTWAHAVDEAADEQISASYEEAAAFARKAVKEDLSHALNQMFARLREFGSTLELTRAYGTFLSEIEAEFLALDAEDLKRLPPDVAGFAKYTARFAETIRKKFLASWVPVIQANEYQSARAMIRHLVEETRHTCVAGRSLRHGNFMMPSPAMPPFLARLQASVTPNYLALLTKGSPVGFSFGFASATAGSAAANRDRGNVLAGVTTASNVANGFYLNAQAVHLWNAIVPSTNVALAGSGSAMGAISNAMVVAAPYLAGVALAAIVAVDLMAKAEAAKLANRVHRARDRQMRRTADYEYVNGVYRDSCAPYVEVLASLERVLEDLDGPRRSVIVAEAQADVADLDIWHRDAAADDERQCRMDLHALHRTFGCAQLAANETLSEHRPHPAQLNSFCVVDAPQKVIRALNGRCTISADEAERSRTFARESEEHAAYEREYSFERVMQLISSQVILAFENRDGLRHRIWTEHVKRIDQLQENVHLGLGEYFSLVRRANETARSLAPFEVARQWRSEILRLQDEVIGHSTDVIAVIFDHGDKARLIAELEDLNGRRADLAGALSGNVQLERLKSAIDSLL